MKVYVVYYTACNGDTKNILAFNEPTKAEAFCEWAERSEEDGGIFDWVVLEVVDAE